MYDSGAQQSIILLHLGKPCIYASDSVLKIFFCLPILPNELEPMIRVAANHENDTCFRNRLVMGLAKCVN